MNTPPNSRPGPVMIDRSKGIPPNKAVELLLLGWTVVPNLAITQGGGVIAVPGGPVPMGTTAIDLWLPPRSPMIPEAAVAQALVMADQQKGDTATLDLVAKDLFDVDYARIRQEFMRVMGTNIVKGVDFAPRAD